MHNAVVERLVKEMKIGDYITVQAIINQSEVRWVVLSDLEEGNYDSVEGGIIRCISSTKREAGDMAIELERNGIDTYLVSGAYEGLVLDGVFVE
jgi:hypothetical protein